MSPNEPFGLDDMEVDNGLVDEDYDTDPDSDWAWSDYEVDDRDKIDGKIQIRCPVCSGLKVSMDRSGRDVVVDCYFCQANGYIILDKDYLQ